MNQIYKITNNVNSKVYIGLTTQNVNRRWSEHLYRFNLGERDHIYKGNNVITRDMYYQPSTTIQKWSTLK